MLLQPAWNDSIAADWNKRLPYSGQDALVGSDDVEAVHEAGPLTQQYKQHIRRASLDTRTLYDQPALNHSRPSHSRACQACRLALLASHALSVSVYRVVAVPAAVSLSCTTYCSHDRASQWE